MIEDRFKSGAVLYGDDLAGDALVRWYEEEAKGYYDLTPDRAARVGNEGLKNWESLNELHIFCQLRDRHFDTMLAFGTADGSGVVPIAGRTHRFIAVEPDRRWWRGNIGGRPTEWAEPEMDGESPIESGTVDLIICLGVLHHVAKVTNTLRAFHHVLKSGGQVFIREPISSMGDWTKPRPMVTRNERGIPPNWLCRTATEVGLEYKTPVLFGFGPLLFAAGRLGLGERGLALTARIDRPLSYLTSRNARFWRPRLVDKFAPGLAYFELTSP